MIEFDLQGFSPTYWRGIYEYQNVFQAYTRGIEWQSEIQINDHLDFDLSYTWLTAKNLETGSWLLNRPEHTVKLYSTYNWEKIGLAVTAWGSWQSGKLWVPIGAQNDFDSEIWAPTRREINLSIAKRVWNNVEVFARGHNLTDDVEVDYGYWPGRSFFAGIRFTTGGKQQ
jgi:outer membrane receptor for ferrienterochelin and colicin